MSPQNVDMSDLLPSRPTPVSAHQPLIPPVSRTYSTKLSLVGSRLCPRRALSELGRNDRKTNERFVDTMLNNQESVKNFKDKWSFDPIAGKPVTRGAGDGVAINYKWQLLHRSCRASDERRQRVRTLFSVVPRTSAQLLPPTVHDTDTTNNKASLNDDSSTINNDQVSSQLTTEVLTESNEECLTVNDRLTAATTVSQVPKEATASEPVTDVPVVTVLPINGSNDTRQTKITGKIL